MLHLCVTSKTNKISCSDVLPVSEYLQFFTHFYSTLFNRYIEASLKLQIMVLLSNAQLVHILLLYTTAHFISQVNSFGQKEKQVQPNQENEHANKLKHLFYCKCEHFTVLPSHAKRKSVKFSKETT